MRMFVDIMKMIMIMNMKMKSKGKRCAKLVYI